MSLRLQVCGALLVAAGWSAWAADPVELKDRQQLADGLFRRSLFDLAAREYAALADTPGAESPHIRNRLP